MARTVDEIKKDMESRWMQNAVLKEMYGWELKSDNTPPDFADYYSKASIENILLYIVAYCAYVLEVLFDNVKAEIEDEIATKVPGSLQWYVEKLKGFMYGFDFDDNTGEWVIPDDTELSTINASKIVKHAVAIDDNANSVLTLKVAREVDGQLKPLDDTQALCLTAYINRIKYAGVKTRLINQEGDMFDCSVKIWYDPLKTEAEVQQECIKAIEKYIKNLPFNGEYSNMALIDYLQTVSGVKVADFRDASYTEQNGQTKTIDGKVRPYAGYFNLGTITLNMEAYG